MTMASRPSTNRLHAQRAACSCLDGAHRNVQTATCHLTIKRLAYFGHLDFERVGDQSDLALPFTRDGARHADPCLVIEGTPESQRVAHDVGHPDSKAP
jgi:hypothetical protein